eukprot:gnl/MRDRNA2_/MRDRNA2_109677_c0_seq1.p1 gnl/MRDRNA2_/MRDRNA2_109677_c0~~gnl/MRDRNA2_/MRDRNA2_109677_c0_seq1.p1  ORF type:complete len:170 (+),score=28.12 gnl/MRDRNA2_/MRDRNA2_109677_c0_seq1:152-661(+)
MGNACTVREAVSGVIPDRKRKQERKSGSFEAAKPFYENQRSQQQNVAYFDIDNGEETDYEESYFGDGKSDADSLDRHVSAWEALIHSCSKLITCMSRNSVQNANLAISCNCWQGLVAIKDKTPKSKPVPRLDKTPKQSPREKVPIQIKPNKVPQLDLSRLPVEENAVGA